MVRRRPDAEQKLGPTEYFHSPLNPGPAAAQSGSRTTPAEASA
jgi:hypothetical protein